MISAVQEESNRLNQPGIGRQMSTNRGGVTSSRQKFAQQPGVWIIETTRCQSGKAADQTLRSPLISIFEEFCQFLIKGQLPRPVDDRVERVNGSRVDNGLVGCATAHQDVMFDLRRLHLPREPFNFDVRPASLLPRLKPMP